MPFGMKTYQATFQRLINSISAGFDGYDASIDDVIRYSDEWKEHLRQIREFFDRISSAKLTVNSEFGEK